MSPITGVTIQLIGLQDTGTVSKHGTLTNTDRLSFGDIASCGKIRADAIALSASPYYISPIKLTRALLSRPPIRLC